MKGRGTRVLSSTDLQSVSGEDAHTKDHFVIVDAVGVCESDKSDSRPLERKRNVAFKDLLLGVTLGKRDEDTLTTLAGRLARLDRELEPAQRNQVREISDGISLVQMSSNLLRAIDPDIVEAASRRFYPELAEHIPHFSVNDDPNEIEEIAGYFDPLEPVEFYRINLPHLRQEGVMYFVTFRLADSMPAEKLKEWIKERETWLRIHPAPLTPEQQQEYRKRFTAKIEHWLDQGSGSCILAMPECRTIVENALKHFDGERYELGEFVVASNHVHVIVSPKPGHELSEILHSWKSFTAHEILKVEAASRRLIGDLKNRESTNRVKRRDGASTSGLHVWQKESYDHIVRGAAARAKIEEYIKAHCRSAVPALPTEDQRRAAAATLIAEACSPFDKPAVRDTLIRLKQLNEQTIDNVSRDVVINQGFDAAAKEKAESTVRSFREYIDEHKAEIEALQILYSRPFRKRLTEEALKDLEAKLKPEFGPNPITTVWSAIERSSAVPALHPATEIAPSTETKRRDGASTLHRFTDLVSLVRFAWKQEPVLEPFEAHVNRRFNAWLEEKKSAGKLFSFDELAWLEKMRDYIIASSSVDRDHLEADNVLGPIYGVFGEKLWALMDEMNLVLAA